MRYVVNLINEYDPGPFPDEFEGKTIQLASNENPFPPSERVLKAIKRNIFKISRYPYPYYSRLKEELSSYTGVDENCIAVSNGASDLIRLVADLIIEPFDRVYIPMPSYTMYLMFSMLRDAHVETRVFEGYRVDGCYSKGKLAFLCSPNNPTGNVIETKTIQEFLENFEYVVVDEAYAEFYGESCQGLLDHYDNLVVLRSFSKFFGLAGMRVGYALACEEIAGSIEKIRNPFSVSHLGYVSAIEALKSVEYYKKIARIIARERERIRNKLEKRFYVYPSRANFLLVKHSQKDLVERLKERGILVRDVTGLEGLEGEHFRVSVGRPEENSIFLKAIEEL